jgi:hypothetical protein
MKSSTRRRKLLADSVSIAATRSPAARVPMLSSRSTIRTPHLRRLRSGTTSPLFPSCKRLPSRPPSVLRSTRRLLRDSGRPRRTMTVSGRAPLPQASSLLLDRPTDSRNLSPTPPQPPTTERYLPPLGVNQISYPALLSDHHLFLCPPILHPISTP